MTTFKQYIQGLAPAWLSDAVGQALTGALSTPLDELLMRLKDGIKAKLAGQAPRDALGAIAFERKLPRGLGESDASWATRLRQGFELWSWAGTNTGILTALYSAGYAPQLIIGQGKEFELDIATGQTLSTNAWSSSNLDLGLGASFWSEFVLFFPTARWPAAWTTAGVPPLQSTPEALRFIALARQWKPGFATLRAVVMQGSAPICGYPGLLCGASGVTAGGTYWSWNPVPPLTDLS